MAKQKIKIIITIAMLFLAFVTVIAIPQKTAFCAENARGIALIDGETGILIYGENQDQIKEMASTTKIFTAFFTIEKCKADKIDITQPREIKKEWTGIEGSSIYLKEGEKVSIEELLYGLMLRSGNDSAEALAGIVFGGAQEYVTYANKRLKEMGYEKTSLQNPHGLPAKNHHTTAKELAKFSASAMKDPLFVKIVSSKSYRGERTLYVNKNKILQNVEGGNGIKTGYTKSAGRCLVSGCKRDGNQIVLVTLNTYDMFERSKAHLENFFQKYEYKDISSELSKNAIPLEIPGVTAEIAMKNGAAKIPIPKNAKIRLEIKTLNQVPLFTKSGTQVGEMKVYVNNCLFCTEKLYTVNTCSGI